MGDDMRLPERNAIRPAMQWSGERNGGFSRVASKKLRIPTISEGEYRFERVNVAAQRLDENSFLNWTERAIRTRKECPEFGWGKMQFLRTDKPSVLAHACTWNGRTVIAVHNFSRASVSVKIEWPKGTTQKLHVFGRTVREPLPQHSPMLDLDGYDYQWLRVQPDSSAPQETT